MSLTTTWHVFLIDCGVRSVVRLYWGCFLLQSLGLSRVSVGRWTFLVGFGGLVPRGARRGLLFESLRLPRWCEVLLRSCLYHFRTHDPDLFSRSIFLGNIFSRCIFFQKFRGKLFGGFRQFFSRSVLFRCFWCIFFGSFWRLFLWGLASEFIFFGGAALWWLILRSLPFVAPPSGTERIRWLLAVFQYYFSTMLVFLEINESRKYPIILLNYLRASCHQFQTYQKHYVHQHKSDPRIFVDKPVIL